jgi:hypothetical protein
VFHVGMNILMHFISEPFSKFLTSYTFFRVRIFALSVPQGSCRMHFVSISNNLGFASEHALTALSM